mgnify:CR=1 FL=1
MSKFEFTWYGFILGYDDFDQEHVIITAENETAARQILNKRCIATHEPHLIAIDGVPVTKSPFLIEK